MQLRTCTIKGPFRTRKSPWNKPTETVEETDGAKIETAEMAEIAGIEETIPEIEGEMMMEEDHEDIHQATSALDAVEQVTGK